MSVKVEKTGVPVWLGEGPHWSGDSKCLYFVDVLSKTVNRFDPATGKTYSAQLDTLASLVVPVAGRRDEFVLALGRRLVRVQWDGVGGELEQLETLAEVETLPAQEAHHFNDGKADPRGRLWAGTIHRGTDGAFVPDAGSLYSWSRDEGVVRHVTGLTISNGIVWSLDGKTVYFIDSPKHRVDAFDCDLDKPALSNRRTLFDMKAHGLEGLLDGMTIDSDGNLWAAVFGGAQVLNIDPCSGKLLRAVPIPALNVTSVAFGGTNLDELFVTTANYRLSEEQAKTYPDSGATFRVTGLGVRGMPMQNVKL